MRHLRTAGLASTLPARSLARTRNAWRPASSPRYVVGEAQERQRLWSTRHWNRERASLERNRNLAAALGLRRRGPAVTLVFGAVVSTVQLWLAVLALPAVSVASTTNVCRPSPRPSYRFGETHGDHGVSSMLHLRREAPVEEKLRVPDLLEDAAAGPRIAGRLGGTVSTVHVHAAGLGSTRPHGSIARTWNA